MKTFFEHPKTTGDEEDRKTSIIAKVNPFGPEWVQRKEENKENSTNQYSIFGVNALDRIDRTQKNGTFYTLARRYGMSPSAIEESTAHAIKQLPKVFLELQDTLEKSAKHNPELVYQLFYSYLIQSPHILKDIQDLGFNGDEFTYNDTDEEVNDLIGISPIDNPDAYASAKQHFIANEIAEIITSQYADRAGITWSDKPIFTKILSHHIQEEERREKKLIEIAKDFRKRFITIFQQSDYASLVPEQILHERLDNLEVTVLDGLTASFQEVSGDYDAHAHAIRIASNLSKEFIWCVYVHEALHALSGKTEIIDFSKEFPDLLTSLDTKVGLDLSTKSTLIYSETNIKQPHLIWLNEAMTESVTMSLVGGKDMRIYKYERDLLDLLVSTGGIPRDVITKAYFENFEGERLPNHPTPALKQLFDVTNAKLGKRFLVNLDLWIRFQGTTTQKRSIDGLKLAVQKWKELGADFPAHLEKEAANIRTLLKNVP